MEYGLQFRLSVSALAPESNVDAMLAENVSGVVRGRIRDDGAVDVSLTTHRAFAVEGSASDRRGQKNFTVTRTKSHAVSGTITFEEIVAKRFSTAKAPERPLTLDEAAVRFGLSSNEIGAIHTFLRKRRTAVRLGRKEGSRTSSRSGNYARKVARKR